MSSTSDTVALQEATEELWLRAVPLLVESILFGVFSLLFMASTYLLLQRGLKLWANAFMLGAVLVMYASSLAYLLVDFISFLDTARNPVGHYETSPGEFKAQSIGITVCLGLNFLLSDALVLWRAVIFWAGNKIITYVSVAMLFASLVLGVLDVATDRNHLSEWGGTPVSMKIPQATMNGFGIAMVVVSLAANFWATGLIAVKACFANLYGYQGSEAQVYASSSSVAGVAYSAIWIAFIGVSLNTTTSLNSIIWQLAFEKAVAMCTGIYLTAVVSLVSLQMCGANVSDFLRALPPEYTLAAAPTLTQTAVIYRTGPAYTVRTDIPEPDSSSSRSAPQENSRPCGIQLRSCATHSSHTAASSSDVGTQVQPARR